MQIIARKATVPELGVRQLRQLRVEDRRHPASAIGGEACTDPEPEVI
jgi:hypothetical protein